MDQAALRHSEETQLKKPLRLAALPSAQPTYVAATGRRVQAFFIDEFLRLLAFVPWWIAMGWQMPTMETVQLSWGWLSLCYGFHFSARVVCLRLVGATPGKFVMGLRLVGRDQEKLEWSQALLRTLTDDLSAVLGLATRVLAFIRFDRTHLSDWIAETRVVQLKPRASIVHRRWAVAVFLFVFLAFQGLESSVHWLNSL